MPHTRATSCFAAPVLPLAPGARGRVPRCGPLAPRMVAAPEKTPPPSSPSPPSIARLSVLLPEKLSEEGVGLLSASHNVVQNLTLSPEELVREIAHHEAIIVRSGTRLTREVIEAGTRLKVIGRAGVGVDNIDIPAATERGVLVVNAPTGNCVAAAEHAIALMCALARLVAPADARIKTGGWDRSSFVGASLLNKTLGLIGFGRIGRLVAQRAQGLGMHIVASDPFTSKDTAASFGVELVAADEVYARADFVSLHVPLVDSTRHLINARVFALMKDGVRIINAARGGVIHEQALLDALQSGKVAGAALDCFEFEPPNKHPDSVSAKVAAHDRVLATPHLGASTREAQEDVAVEIASAVVGALGGDLVPNMVNVPAVNPETLKALKPRSVLCERLAKLAYYLSGGRMAGEVTVNYYISDASEDTRLLRAGVIKGLMEAGLGMQITIVNAESVAKKHSLKLTEVNHFADSKDSPREVTVDVTGAPIVEGRVTNGNPHVTRIGRFELDMCLEGTIVAYSQNDRPGQLGRIGSLLGQNDINISFMTLARDRNSDKALVLLGLDSVPSDKVLAEVGALIGDPELTALVINF